MLVGKKGIISLRNKYECGRRDLNPSYKLGKLELIEEKHKINKNQIEKYFSLREIEGISESWYNQSKTYLMKYLKYVSWEIDENRTLKYIKDLKKNNSVTYYRKIVYQIRKFLTYLDCEWANKIKLPAEPVYFPKRINLRKIEEAYSYFDNNPYYIQIKALILLGMSSGARAEELYQLNIEDINLEKRILYINHNPKNGQSTKTKMSRISFFNNEAKYALSKYLTYFHNDVNLKVLFSSSHISRLFRKSPIKVKDFRKYFSQEWDRRGGPTSIKKILMGHSLKGDVDLMHYNAQSEEDLKKIYDKVMGENNII
jgi:integrase/recombinase XerD